MASAARAPAGLLMPFGLPNRRGRCRAAMGLAGVALRSGARSALASLWYVNDGSTAELSSTFYNNLVGKRQTRAVHARGTKLAMLRSDKFGHPAYWAPFLMVGAGFERAVNICATRFCRLLILIGLRRHGHAGLRHVSRAGGDGFSCTIASPPSARHARHIRTSR